VQHTLPSGPNPDPLHRHTQESLDELDVPFRVLWERGVRLASVDGRAPSGEGGVFDLNFSEDIEVGFRTF